MNYGQLVSIIQKKRSFLCVGLDSDILRIPKHLLQEDDPIFSFNKQIINSTLPYAVAYKPNIAFYESLGAKGWQSLEKTIGYLRKQTDQVFIIADAKRGDIGNTSSLYAKTFFEHINFDAITLSPYMGYDTVKPFLNYNNKWVVLLALTSNESAADFQYFENEKNEKLYEKIIKTSKEWTSAKHLMYVIGATKAKALKEIRKIIPKHFLLIPGVGAQGGSLSEVSENGMNKQCGLLVNSSRGIIYASSGYDFAEAAAKKARTLQHQMEQLLMEKGIC